MRWVDSVYNRLTPDERIGQLFMVAAYSGGKNYNDALVSSLVAKGQVGGLIFMQGGPVRQAVLTNKYQSAAKVPLLLAMDAEWGLGMRLDSVLNFPRQMMLGATADTSLSYRLGAAIAAQCNRLGVHINFAPVVDVNNNPGNPVINARSFGEDKRNVARMGIAYMRGMQDRSVMASAKHFPGHGDTDVDSHKDLPVIKKSLAQLDTLELYPFRELVNAGVQSVMVAHLEIPALETEPRVPTTLSKNTVTTLLRDKMGFDGLVFTDALNMQGVAKYFPGGEADVRAFIAGADVLLFSENVPAGIAKIKSALSSGRATEAQLARSVKKILAAKWEAGLNARPQPISTANIVADLNRVTISLRRSITESATTFARGEDSKPVRALRSGESRVLYVGVNAGSSAIPSTLKPAAIRWVPKGVNGASIIAEMKNYDAVVVGVHNLGIYPAGNYGLDASQLSFLKSAAAKDNAVMVVLGNAYALGPFCNAPAVVVTYEGDSIAERTAAQVLLGQRRARGVLPVTPCAGLKPKPAATNFGTGAVMPGNNTATSQGFAQQSYTAHQQPFTGPIPFSLKEASALAAGATDSSKLGLLDAYLRNCVSQGVFPGCRVLAAKDGKIFYDRAVGRQTYDPASPAVERTTLYDVASLTKVLATNIAVMKLWEEGKIGLEKTVGDYLKWTRGTDKGSIRIRDLLLHQAGL
jgi:beta-glucosidase-like glycosyl hydrolase